MADQDTPALSVRVIDASLAGAQGGPVHLVVSGLDRVDEIADAAASAGGRASVADGRLDVVTVPTRLVDAAGRVGGAALAGPLGEALEQAVAAWSRRGEDITTPAGPLPTSRRAAVMGILNVTPDSFSDGGVHSTTDLAVEHGLRLAEEGADIVDVGGESTRPGAPAVDSRDEMERVLPVVERLSREGVKVSIDTTKAEVARHAVEAGAVMVNDVSAGLADETMLTVVSRLRVPYVAMHAQGTPRTMQDNPTYDDVVAEVHEYLVAAVRRCVAAGVEEDRIVLDPGIGFGKTVEHNLAILGALAQFRSAGRPLLIGASRKSFIGAITGVEDPSQRLAGSLAVAVAAVDAGVAIIRVHDVAETVRAVRVAQAIAAGAPVDWDAGADA